MPEVLKNEIEELVTFLNDVSYTAKNLDTISNIIHNICAEVSILCSKNSCKFDHNNIQDLFELVALLHKKILAEKEKIQS